MVLNITFNRIIENYVMQCMFYLKLLGKHMVFVYKTYVVNNYNLRLILKKCSDISWPRPAASTPSQVLSLANIRWKFFPMLIVPRKLVICLLILHIHQTLSLQLVPLVNPSQFKCRRGRRHNTGKQLLVSLIELFNKNSLMQNAPWWNKAPLRIKMRVRTMEIQPMELSYMHRKWQIMKSLKQTAIAQVMPQQVWVWEMLFNFSSARSCFWACATLSSYTDVPFLLLEMTDLWSESMFTQIKFKIDKT